MTAKTHVAGGILAGEIAAILLFGNDTAASALCIASASGCSLLPDIDNIDSREGHKKPLLSAGISALFGHRGFCHTPLAAFLFYLVLSSTAFAGFGYSSAAAVGALVGIMSHLILDSFNYAGIMWLYPFKKRRYHWGRIRNRSSEETILMVVLTALVVALSTQYLLSLPSDFSYLTGT